jgi:hypothetical protein
MSGKLQSFADSLWTSSTTIRFAGMWFPHVMTVIRLADGSLVLHSPCFPSVDLHAQVRQLGDVAHVVAPNWFHDLYLKEYKRSYPEATFWGPPFLRRRAPRLIDRVIEDTTQTPWSSEMPHTVIRGLLTFDEVVFFHIRTRTAIVADLLMNVAADRTTPLYTRLMYKVSGVDGKLAVAPYLRWFSLTNRAEQRRAAQRLVQWQPERLIVGHGLPICDDATTRLREALSWLL